LPKRKRSVSRRKRWPGNFGIAILDSLLVRIFLPTGAVGLALFVGKQGWGLFNSVAWPMAAEVTVSILILDAAIYFQHRLFHGVPVLWRLHRMHHADLDVDATTGNRFHPIEILLSIGIKFGVIAAVGASGPSVLLFEILLNATSLFNHANLRMPAWLEPVLRWMVVTPDMHRVHHSIHRDETNSNYGFNLPIWDRIFRTYRAQPRDGHEAMTLGIQEFRDEKELKLWRLVAQPLANGEIKTPKLPNG
jgi:sterol desaturase/sphingolipid hydroxylase (fatty acid hydroxylase superfamily)